MHISNRFSEGQKKLLVDIDETISFYPEERQYDKAEPIIENGTADFQIASRQSLNNNIEFSTKSTTSVENRADLRSGGKYHRVRMHPTGRWTNAIGFDLTVTPQGSR